MAHQLQRLTHCLNCGDETTKNYCANCGQENEDQTASIKAVLEDFLDDIIHFDSRLVRSLIPLMFKPGFLTVEYNKGRRVSYLSPYRMFLFVSAMFFLVIAVSDTQLNVEDANSSAPSQANSSAASNRTLEDLKKSGITVTPLTKDHKVMSVTVDPGNLSNLGSTIKSAVKDATANSKDKKSDDDSDDVSGSDDSSPTDVNMSNGTLSVFGTKIDLNNLPTTVGDYNSKQAALPAAKRDPTWVQKLKRNIILVKQDPNFLKDRLLDYIPKMTFFLVPVFAFTLYPMYLRKRRFYVEHLIYSLHTHAFVFIVFTIFVISDLPVFQHIPTYKHIGDLVQLGLLVWIPVYLYLAMKRVYGDSRGKTLIKFAISWSNYWVILTIALVAVLAVAFLT